MVEPKPEKPDEEMKLEEGSCPMSLQDIYVLFYTLIKQNQALHPGSKMSFDLKLFKNLPKKIGIHFEKKHGRLFAWIPSKRKDRKKKSNLYLPSHKIVTPN